MNTKRCFVIAPIGEESSSTRLRSNQILTHIIRPVAAKFGFDVTRADEMAEPGIISTQIIDRIVNDALVIADLTERNPNVYYELAVRHATRKPVIQLIQKGEPLPFDVAGTRAIIFDYRDLDSVEDAKKQLTRYIENIENGSVDDFDSPISLAFDLQAMRGSNDPQQASLADIAERMTRVDGGVATIQNFIDGRLAHRLDQLLRVVTELENHTSNESSSDDVSELNESIEDLRTRLVNAVSKILDEIQGQHLELSKQIQAVFEEQSETATETVRKSFAEEIKIVVQDDANRKRLLEQLVKVFMHGMASMGTYQQINVSERTQASTHTIREQINKSIEEVFHGIDKVKHQARTLELLAPPSRQKHRD